METHYTIQAAQIFTILFVMVGPLRLLSSFSPVSMSLGPQERRTFAIKTASISSLALIFAGFLGSKILENWNIDPATILLAAGFLFFLSGIHPLIYPNEKTKEVLTDKSPASIALNMVISPFGLATVIVLFSLAHDVKRYLTIIICILAVMILDLLFMAYSKPKDAAEKSILSKIVSVTMATMQFALSLQIIILSLRMLGIIDNI